LPADIALTRAGALGVASVSEPIRRESTLEVSPDAAPRAY
jgi:hypothetical protein